MTTRSKKTRKSALAQLEAVTSGPLTFAELFRSVREGEEWTQAQYGEMLGLSRQKVCDFEKGRRLPSAAKAAEFARMLGYHPESFAQLIFEEHIAAAGLKLKVVPAS